MLNPHRRAALPLLRYAAATTLLLLSAQALSWAQLPPEQSGQPSISTEAPGKAAEDRAQDAAQQAAQDQQTMPQFPGGQEALFRFVGENLRYPEEARKEKIQGRVIVQFTVDATGEVRDAKLIQGIHPGCDEEALRVLRAMPNWEPGTLNGKPVAVAMTLPVVYALK